MSGNSFREWLYEQLITGGFIEEDDFDVETYDAEEVVSCVDDIDEDSLATYAHMYREACDRDNVEPDFDGFEDFAE